MPDPDQKLMMHTQEGLKKIDEMSREELITLVYMLHRDLERASESHNQTLRIMSSLTKRERRLGK